MALENATYVSQLVPSNPVSTDSVAQADDHLRLIKQALKNSFPNVDGPVTASAAALSSLTGTNTVPTGLIAMWFGSIGSIPTGWQLCDGTNGTPNLRDKFIVGAGTTYAPNTLGGSVTSGTGGGATVTTSSAGSHSHSGYTGGTALSVGQMPSHTHDLSLKYTQVGGAGSSRQYWTKSAVDTLYDGTVSAGATATGAGETHNHVIDSDGSHTHSVTLADHTHSVLPPYYALCYIMKV